MLVFLSNRISAGMVGFESPAAEYKQMPITLDQLLIEDPAATFVCLVDGDSMVDVGIFHGDLLVVSRSTTPLTGDIVVANLNGLLVCKEIDTQKRCLLSRAEGFKTYYFKEDETVEILGVVIRSVRMHRPLKVEIK